jgi:hypothetical protein
MSIDIKIGINEITPNELGNIFKSYRDSFDIEENFLDDLYIKYVGIHLLRTVREFKYLNKSAESFFSLEVINNGGKLRFEGYSFPEDPDQEEKESKLIAKLHEHFGNDDTIELKNPN